MVSAAALDAHAVQITGATGFQIVSRLTGPGSINATSNVGIGGTDLGHTVNHNGKTYFLFGDTFSGDTPAAGGNWRSNVMSWTTDTTPADGVVFDDWMKTSGVAKEVIASGAGNPITEIPTGAISVNNRIYAWYMSVNNWGTPGNWTLARAGLARWQEGESSFTDVATFSFAGNSNFGMVAAAQRSPAENVVDDNVYLWGTPSGRFGGVKLARVAPSLIESKSSYQYLSGVINDIPVWTGVESAATTIVPAAVGEMSVMYNAGIGAWTMMYFDEVDDAFEIRQSPTPWGNWSNPVTIATSAQAPGGLYAPYMNPQWTADGGRTLYFTMSLWNSYDVYLAKTTLVLAPEPGASFAAAMILGVFARRKKTGLS
jgi:hypothetical protein